MSRRFAALTLACVAAAPAPFHFVLADSHSLRSNNGLRVEVRVPRPFRLLRPTSRHASFDGHPYQVSMGAFTTPAKVVMLHAERVADGSGHSNYDDLPKSPWKWFHLRSQCAVISGSDVSGEHDLQWLADRGWPPLGSIAVEQHLMTSADHNREVVVSLIAKVRDCADKTSVEAALAALRGEVTLVALKPARQGG